MEGETVRNYEARCFPLPETCDVIGTSGNLVPGPRIEIFIQSGSRFVRHRRATH